jgi:hypothetical protein
MRNRILTFLVVAGSALALPAAGQAAGDRSPSQPLGFGIAPTGTSGPYFVLHAARGAMVTGRLLVFNVTRHPLTVVLRPADANTAATGGADFGTHPPSGDGAWLSLVERVVPLAPSAREEIPFTARIPAGALAGEHFAGITAYNAAALALLHRQQHSPAAQRFSIHAITRLAVAVEFKVPGPTHAALQAGPPAFSAEPSGTSVTLPVHNTGNLLIPGTTGDLTLTQGSRVLRHMPVLLTSFIPRTQIVIPVPLTGAPVEGPYRLRGVLRPQNASPVQIDSLVTFGSSQAKAVQQATGQKAIPSASIPAWIVALLGVALLVALLAVVALLRSRR